MNKEELIALLKRQDELWGYQPKCPACRSSQVQIKNTAKPAKWRCRICKEQFVDEPSKED